jgi:hypothetical protein
MICKQREYLTGILAFGGTRAHQVMLLVFSTFSTNDNKL